MASFLKKVGKAVKSAARAPVSIAKTAVRGVAPGRSKTSTSSVISAVQKQVAAQRSGANLFADGSPCGSRSDPYSKVWRGGRCLPNAAANVKRGSASVYVKPAVPAAGGGGVGATPTVVGGSANWMSPAVLPGGVPLASQITGGLPPAPTAEQMVGASLGVETPPQVTMPTTPAEVPASQVEASLLTSKNGTAAPKAGGAGALLAGAAAGFVLGGPVGAALGAAAGAMLGGKPKPTTASESEAGVAAAYAAAAKDRAIQATEANAQESVAQLQGFMLSRR